MTGRLQPAGRPLADTKTERKLYGVEARNLKEQRKVMTNQHAQQVIAWLFYIHYHNEKTYDKIPSKKMYNGESLEPKVHTQAYSHF